MKMGTGTFFYLLLGFSGLSPCWSQDFQPIMHYVLTPIELFRIPRPVYEPQIHVLPTEDLGQLVVSHPNNEYFRNLLIHTVTYDPVDIENKVIGIRAGDQQLPSDPCNKTPSAETPVITEPTITDVEMLNSTDTDNKTSGMTARIIEVTMDANKTDDEDDAGSVELTTPRLQGEEKAGNKTERIVTRRSPASAKGFGGPSWPLSKHTRLYRQGKPTGRGSYGVSYGNYDSDEEDDFDSNMSSSEPDSYEYENDKYNYHYDNDNYDEDHYDSSEHDDNHIGDTLLHHKDQMDHDDDDDDNDDDGDHIGNTLLHHKNHKRPKNDRFLDPDQILADAGDILNDDDTFRFDHKTSDHKVLDYKRTDKKVQPNQGPNSETKQG